MWSSYGYWKARASVWSLEEREGRGEERGCHSQLFIYLLNTWMWPLFKSTHTHTLSSFGQSLQVKHLLIYLFIYFWVNGFSMGVQCTLYKLSVAVFLLSLFGFSSFLFSLIHTYFSFEKAIPRITYLGLYHF